MSKRNHSPQPKTEKVKSDEQQHKSGNNLGAIIGAAAIIIAAIIAYFGSIGPTSLTIKATQTAEARLTTVAMTTQVFLRQITDTPIPSFTPLSVPIETETPTSTPALSATPSVTPTEIKPIRYEYTVQVGDTLKEISKKFFIVDFYADAIGRANCNPKPVAGNILVIRYYYIQQGDTLELITQRFGSKVDFIRHINNLSQEVTLLPVGQTLILPGDCGG